jgi:hypothetical protein
MNLRLVKTKTTQEFEKKLIKLWSNTKFKAKTGSGINVTSRVPVIIPLGIKHFSFS